MKVLAIIGSPRKTGNSYKVTKRLEEKMKELGDVEFDYLFLQDAHLEPCRGCFTCIAKGEDLCPIKDDRDKILEQMLAADGLVLVSPAYFCNVTSLMKNFIDRFAYLTHRPLFFDKHAIAVSTSAGVGLKETLNYLGMVAMGWELPLVAKLGAWTPLYSLAPKEVYKLEHKISATARKFYKALKKKGRPSPGLAGLLHFRFMRYHSVLEKHYFPADYSYFEQRGLLDENKKYYVDARIDPFKDAAARLIERIIRPRMRKALGIDDQAEELSNGSHHYQKDQAEGGG